MGRTQNHWPPFVERLIRQRQRQSCIGKPWVFHLYLPILPTGGLFASRIWVHGACPEKFIVLGYLASTNVKRVSESLILTRSQGCGWTATMSSLCGWWLTALGRWIQNLILEIYRTAQTDTKISCSSGIWFSPKGETWCDRWNPKKMIRVGFELCHHGPFL